MNDLAARIDALAEFLVLWNGRDSAPLRESFHAIGVIAGESGHPASAEACREACRRLDAVAPGSHPAGSHPAGSHPAGSHPAGTDSAGTDSKSLAAFLGDVVSALQDDLVNGRNPDEIAFFKRAAAASATPSQYFDQKILSDFLARQDGVMEEFESLILDWEKRKDEESMREILRLMHTVKGETALLGLSEIEALCHAIEDYLGRLGEAAKIDLLLDTKDWFLQVFRFHSGRGGAPAPAEELLGRLRELPAAVSAPSFADQAEQIEQIEQTEQTGQPRSAPEAAGLDLTAWCVIPAGTDRDILNDFISESREHLEISDLKIMSLETNPKDQAAVDAVFRAFHSIKGVAAFLGLEGIRTLAHEAETLLDKIRSGEFTFSSGLVDLFLESVDAMRKLLAALMGTSEHAPGPEERDGWNALLGRIRSAIAGKASGKTPVAGHPEHLAPASGMKLGEILVQAGAVTSEDLQGALSSQELGEGNGRLGELLVQDGKASAQAVTQALRSQKSSSEESPAADRAVVAVKETVKVEADRLDRLLDAIGELVIAESMIVQSPELRGKVSSTMAQRLTHLDKITRGLQEMGTSLRMVPIRPVFQKMARLVRDLSKKQGKIIEFNTTGDQTELDKTVVEKIGDPLVHMVRNAIDHGIEGDSAQRVQAGKPASATVHLSAFQKGGNICIKLQDDGRGLNREAILAKARENGLIKPDAVLEDRDIWQLIFAPGFSTAKAVTETSGRGVGMDVVKRNVEELRGRIDIQTQPGAGTTFSIWLPLTLAIIDGMIVRLGKERFIFPTLSILRIVPLSPEEIHTVLDKGEMLKIQDEMIPLLRLHQIYPGFTSEGWSRLAVIVESDGKKVGIPVDELLGQQQIVIKGLGEAFKNIIGLTGGAILSDGNVGMILDVDGLLKCLHLEDVRV
jgi:two-component system chemotaxis sensor kinase CheA